MSDSPYSDLDRPPLNAVALRRALVVPGGVWTRVDLRAETGSTNADAVRAARDGEGEGLVVVAERQHAGRGRLGREWSSPPRAGLAVSVLLRPGEAVPERGWSPVPTARYGWLPLLAGVALVAAVRRLADVDAALKWPNDLLIRPAADQRTGGGIAPSAGSGNGTGRDVDLGDYRKCAGILAEAAPPAVVVGIGLNVTLRADELPDTGTGVPATSLRLAGARTIDRDPLLRALLRELAGWYGRWRDSTGDPDACGLRQAYADACATVGRTVRVLLPDGAELAGTATGVDGDGRLTVRTADGERAIAAGDVLHVR